jgi:cell division protein FtsB
MRIFTLVLVALLALVQGELWFGKAGLARVHELQTRLDAQREKNAVSRTRNDQILAEVRDLKEGEEMVEEKARYELGMIKKDEIYVQLSRSVTR